MAGNTSHEDLLRLLDEQHKAYLKTFKSVHEALAHSVAHGLGPTPKRRRRSTNDPTEIEKPLLKVMATTQSVTTGESDYSDEDDELYVQDTLQPYNFDTENLRQHLKTYRFNEGGFEVLKTVISKTGRLLNPQELFPQYPPEEKYHNSHYSVFDVGTDGAPVSRRKVVSTGSTIDSAIWQAIRDLNSISTSRPKVGRITIIREPAPIILGALHLTMNNDFDMDEVFQYLVSPDSSSAQIADRAYSTDARRQRSFVFNFDYYTVIGDDCAPMPWQLTDIVPKKTGEHIPISRCSSVVALSLAGDCVKEFESTHRRSRTQRGYIYDPWAPWHVLNIQCYPDHKHSMDSHDSTKHYVNGPEAFLTTLLAEFKDAQKRFEEISYRITRLVTPPPLFMFSRKLRDELLFEDKDFTYSRRYFWAFQTLGTMKNAIKAIIDAYEDTFTDEVWEGKHKTLWPMLDKQSARNVYWRKRMHSLKKDFEKEIRGLAKLYDENDDLRKDIRTLRDQLFSGTSVLESRKSVELSTVTITQGHNIKLLTLVSIFFLPLTFVTSVFGMTNMPPEHQFKTFGIVMAVVCLPFFVLIGSLNTTSGMEFWRTKWHDFVKWTRVITPKKQAPEKEIEEPRKRSHSTYRAMEIRGNQLRRPSSPRPTTTGRTSATSVTNVVMQPIEMDDIAVMDDSDSGRKPTVITCENDAPARPEISTSQRIPSPRSETLSPAISWRESIFGRKRKENRLPI